VPDGAQPPWRAAPVADAPARRDSLRSHDFSTRVREGLDRTGATCTKASPASSTAGTT